MCAFIAESHGADEALVLYGPPREIRAHKRRLGDHPLPPLLLGLGTRLDDLEHLVLGDSLDARQRDREFRGFLLPLLLDRGRQRLGDVGLLAVEEVRRKRLRGGRGWSRGFHRLLLVRFERLAQLQLLGVPLLGVEFGSQPVQLLRIFRQLVRFASGLFALAFFVVEAGGSVSAGRGGEGWRGGRREGGGTAGRAAASSARCTRSEAAGELVMVWKQFMVIYQKSL